MPIVFFILELVLSAVPPSHKRAQLEKVLKQNQAPVEAPSSMRLGKDASSMPVADHKIIDGAIRISGPLSTKEVRRAFALVSHTLRQCYEESGETLPVSIPLTLECTPDGRAVATIDRKDALGECVQSVLSRMRFVEKDKASKVALKLTLKRWALRRE